MSYHQFKDPVTGVSFGSFEVFYHEGGYDMMPESVAKERGIEPMKPGWYWWPCFPGCLPDGPEHGPFASEQEATDNAKVSG